MIKYCSICDKDIEKHNNEEKWTMVITKKGQKIIELECFHLKCWKKFLIENGVKIVEREWS